MHIIVLLLGLEFVLFAYSLPIAGGGQFVGSDKPPSPTDVKKRFLFGDTGGGSNLLTEDAFQAIDDLEDNNFFLASDPNPGSPCSDKFSGIGYAAGCVIPSGNTRGHSTPPSLRLQPQNLPAPQLPAFPKSPSMPLINMPNKISPSIPTYGTTEEPMYDPPGNPNTKIWDP
ncbi:hypothetical protein MMC29_004732 [Sticta canariensis]|nr:hypothetical protein [Sticta canariensis]